MQASRECEPPVSALADAHRRAEPADAEESRAAVPEPQQAPAKAQVWAVATGAVRESARATNPLPRRGSAERPAPRARASTSEPAEEPVVEGEASRGCEPPVSRARCRFAPRRSRSPQVACRPP